MNPETGIQKPEGKPLAPARSFEQLIVWQKAHQFVLGVYRFTDNFPRNEMFGLTSQLRRAAASIPANIAEGFKKRGHADKVHFHLTTQLQLEETSKLLEAYSAKILASGF
jgi:four helix bundle protein